MSGIPSGLQSRRGLLQACSSALFRWLGLAKAYDRQQLARRFTTQNESTRSVHTAEPRTMPQKMPPAEPSGLRVTRPKPAWPSRDLLVAGPQIIRVAWVAAQEPQRAEVPEPNDRGDEN